MMNKEELLRLLRSLEADDTVHFVFSLCDEAGTRMQFAHALEKRADMRQLVDQFDDALGEIDVYRDCEDRITVDVGMHGEGILRDWVIRPL